MGLRLLRNGFTRKGLVHKTTAIQNSQLYVKKLKTIHISKIELLCHNAAKYTKKKFSKDFIRFIFGTVNVSGLSLIKEKCLLPQP